MVDTRETTKNSTTGHPAWWWTVVIAVTLVILLACGIFIARSGSFSRHRSEGGKRRSQLQSQGGHATQARKGGRKFVTVELNRGVPEQDFGMPGVKDKLERGDGWAYGKPLRVRVRGTGKKDFVVESGATFIETTEGVVADITVTWPNKVPSMLAAKRICLNLLKQGDLHPSDRLKKQLATWDTTGVYSEGGLNTSASVGGKVSKSAGLFAELIPAERGGWVLSINFGITINRRAHLQGIDSRYNNKRNKNKTKR